MKQVLIIQGHPDTTEQDLCHGLADAYRSGVEEAGFSVDTVAVAEPDAGLLQGIPGAEHPQVRQDVSGPRVPVRDGRGGRRGKT